MSASENITSDVEKKALEFLEYLEVEKGYSPLTLRNYRHYLNRFSKFLKNENFKGDVSDIDSETVRKYRIFLSRLVNKNGDSLSRKTQGYHAIALRSFLRWLTKRDFDVLSPDKIDLPKISDRQVKFLSGEKVDRLLNAPSLSKINGKRDKAILEVLYSTGLRVSELVGLNRDNIDLKTREFGVVGKGGKSRVVFLSQRAADWLQKYLDVREDHFKPLFVRHSGKMDPSIADNKMRLSARSVQRMIKKYKKKIGITEDVTPHVLRHSFATDLLMAGADLRSVQEMLGHKNIQTTQIYTHVTHKHLKDVHRAFHDKGGKE
ncbi:tyrosine-type recombinase/integrase [Candidatus Woesebacteria bacterium]|nr:tyrosine-type recombinase/integrase [Candidatus Woesebacteria bacterium]